MSSIQIKHVPDDIHEAASKRAADEGMTLGDYVLKLIERDLALPTQREWLVSLAEREPVEVDVPALLRELREERDEELMERLHWPGVSGW